MIDLPSVGTPGKLLHGGADLFADALAVRPSQAGCSRSPSPYRMWVAASLKLLSDMVISFLGVDREGRTSIELAPN